MSVGRILGHAENSAWAAIAKSTTGAVTQMFSQEKQSLLHMEVSSPELPSEELETDEDQARRECEASGEFILPILARAQEGDRLVVLLQGQGLLPAMSGTRGHDCMEDSGLVRAGLQYERLPKGRFEDADELDRCLFPEELECQNLTGSLEVRELGQAGGEAGDRAAQATAGALGSWRWFDGSPSRRAALCMSPAAPDAITVTEATGGATAVTDWPGFIAFDATFPSEGCCQR